MFTEEEAKTKWCPWARTAWAFDDVRNGIFVTANRGTTEDDCRCIASECMAWRWIYRFEHVETGEGTHHDPKQGFCGLSTKP